PPPLPSPSSSTPRPPPPLSALSLHDALPISLRQPGQPTQRRRRGPRPVPGGRRARPVRARDRGIEPDRLGVCSRWGVCQERDARSEEHTSELQSHLNLVCRLLREKKKATRSK